MELVKAFTNNNNNNNNNNNIKISDLQISKEPHRSVGLSATYQSIASLQNYMINITFRQVYLVSKDRSTNSRLNSYPNFP